MNTMESSEPAAENPATTNPSLAEVGRLAVKLVESGKMPSPSPKLVAQAVSAARGILMELARNPVIHACDVFHPDAVMNYNEISEALKERGWQKLNNNNTLGSRIAEILHELHRDIERRRSFVHSAFRAKHLRQDPEDAELEGKRVMRDLLKRLGMSHGLGGSLEGVVSDSWSRMVETWLRQTTDVAHRLEQTRLHTPEHFSAIVIDLTYENYCSKIAPMPNLSADTLLNVITALAASLRPLPESNGIPRCGFDTLTIINRWPEMLFPDDRSLARPFAELLEDGFSDNQVPANLPALSDDGIRRISATYAAMKMRELSQRLLADQSGQPLPTPRNPEESAEQDAESDEPHAPVSPLDALKRIRNGWYALTGEERENLDDMFPVDPGVIVERVISWLVEGTYRAPLSQHFDGAWLEQPQLHCYAANLDSLGRSISVLGLLASSLAQDFDAERLTQAVNQEKELLGNLAASLIDADGEEAQRRVAEGHSQLKELSKSHGRLGRIRPHLLFAYAREKGLFESELFLPL